MNILFFALASIFILSAPNHTNAREQSTKVRTCSGELTLGPENDKSFIGTGRTACWIDNDAPGAKIIFKKCEFRKQCQIKALVTLDEGQPDAIIEVRESSSSNTESLHTAESDPGKCKKILIQHGMLSRAQFTCGYRRYSNSFIAEAKKCVSLHKGENWDELLKQGMQTFDNLASINGKRNLCNALLQNYRTIVQK